jgi:hypothetical protein
MVSPSGRLTSENVRFSKVSMRPVSTSLLTYGSPTTFLDEEDALLAGWAACTAAEFVALDVGIWAPQDIRG